MIFGSLPANRATASAWRPDREQRHAVSLKQEPGDHKGTLRSPPFAFQFASADVIFVTFTVTVRTPTRERSGCLMEGGRGSEPSASTWEGVNRAARPSRRQISPACGSGVLQGGILYSVGGR